MKIVADENIPLLKDAFGPLGEVVALAADEITPQVLRDAQALLVRSVTRAGAGLLDSTDVRFVGTATIGTDHIDRDYLSRRGIDFTSAQGSNARSVAEYVFAALSVLAERKGLTLADMVLGVVGVGNIGSRVARIAEGIGMRVLRNDPPLARRTGDPKYVPIETVCGEADVVTFHVPLTREEPDATYHMINEGLLRQLKGRAVLINTSRGAVHETAALKAAIAAGHLGAVILDVWENEPNVDPDLLAGADLATPHVAGYSYDGKVNGTRMLLEALCRHFGLRRDWDPAPLMPPPNQPRVRVPAGVSVDEAIRRAIAAAYRIEADDRRLREMLKVPKSDRGAYFKSLRRNYPVRREFPWTTVELESDDAGVRAALRTLGFPVTVASRKGR
ncbi:MAG: 4-phosphoerythronate dehydrogenase [Phycisphaerae bacterium]